MVKYITHSELKRALLILQKADVPACIIGGVGCGKTTAVEDFVSKINKTIDGEYNLWKIFLGMVDSTEIGGVPVRTADNRITYAPPEFLPFNTDAPGVILGDEYDRSDPSVQNAFNQILLGGEIHGNKISKNAFVVLTMNGTSDMYTTQLSEAARTRVCTLFLSSKASMALKDWDEWAEQNNVNDTIRGFAHYRSDLIETHENFEELAMCTSRSRDMAGRILTACDEAGFKTDDIKMPLLSGVIGHSAAVELIAYEQMKNSLPDIELMLAKPHSYETHKCWEEPSLCCAISTAIPGFITEDNVDLAASAITLIGYMPIEIGTWAIRGIAKKCPMVATTDEFINAFNEASDLI